MSSPETGRWIVPPRLAVVNGRVAAQKGSSSGLRGRAWFYWHSNPTSLSVNCRYQLAFIDLMRQSRLGITC